MKKVSLIIILPFLISVQAFCQNLALGEWRVHLPYRSATHITEAGSRIYCVADNGLFYYDKNDNSVQRLSKISGLSDNEVSIAEYNESNNTLLITYQNSNIDLIQNDVIYNISDIKRSTITGDKTIYSVYFKDHFAYLCCGYGISLLDLNKKEIKETYLIGNNGNSLTVYDIVFDGQQYLYAAAADGIYRGDINNPFLNNFTEWTKIKSYPGTGSFRYITYYSNKIITVYRKDSSNDSLLTYDGTNWAAMSNSTYPVNALRTFYNKLLITHLYEVHVLDLSFQLIYNADGNLYPGGNTNFGILDKDGTLWIADNIKGLLKVNMTNDTYETILPNGPGSTLVVSMVYGTDRLWVAQGALVSQIGFSNFYNTDGISYFKDNNWVASKSDPNNPFVKNVLYDLTGIAIDPLNSDHLFLSAWNKGIFEFNDTSLVTIYNNFNSTMEVIQGTTDYIRVGGVVFDGEGNLWSTSSEVGRALNVKTPDGKWYWYSLPSNVKYISDRLGKIIVDDYNQKWTICYGGGRKGIVVFDDNGTLDNSSDDRSALLSDVQGAGGLPSSEVHAIALDKDGSIWVGTAKGVAVFYSPGSVFSGNNYDAQQILIQFDGYNQYLLETEVVTAIAIDGANRKWFGTYSGGVFLMSSDGTKQLLNFNTSNSPILSNNIVDIAIDNKTGEVFFATDAGIISYKGDATEGTEGCEDTYVYPNPVRENYNGPIAITGLAKNSNVKITDISGTLVYETTANGGQAIWNGRNFEGRKANTGVYLVFCSDEDGSNTCITKLLFFN